jgi:hypothetical protein
VPLHDLTPFTVAPQGRLFPAAVRVGLENWQFRLLHGVAIEH